MVYAALVGILVFFVLNFFIDAGLAALIGLAVGLCVFFGVGGPRRL
jgi:hypothetical protein